MPELSFWRRKCHDTAGSNSFELKCVGTSFFAFNNEYHRVGQVWVYEENGKRDHAEFSILFPDCIFYHTKIKNIN